MAATEDRLEDIKARLNALSIDDGDPETVDWQYASGGGPPASATDSDGMPVDPEGTWMYQSVVPDWVKQVRFLDAYIESDGSGGIHNPDYVASMLREAGDLLTANE